MLRVGLDGIGRDHSIRQRPRLVPEFPCVAVSGGGQRHRRSAEKAIPQPWRAVFLRAGRRSFSLPALLGACRFLPRTDGLTGRVQGYGHGTALASRREMPPQHAPQASHPGTPKLLDRLRAAIRLRHFSRRTEQAYVGWVRRYILFHRKRHPSELAEADVTAFLTHLAQGRGVSASTQNQALCGLLFMYRHVLGRELGALDGLVWAKRSSHVPVVLTREEVVSVLGQLSGLSWLIVALLYGAGLRLTECLELRIKDVDMASRQIAVRGGKGQKDRRTMLPSSILEPLERHLRVVQRLHVRACGPVSGVSRCPTRWL